MRKILVSILVALACLSTAEAQEAQGQQQDLAAYFAQLVGRDDVFAYRGKQADIYGRFNNPAPVFMIFPDGRTSKAAADMMIADSGLQQIIDDFGGSAYVINPIGEKYDNVKDLESYIAFVERLRIAFNIKVVGIGSGATFVNETIGRKAGNVAGIVSVGGKVPKQALAGESPVPAFITGKNAKKIAAGYISRDTAQLQSKDGNMSVYANADEPLLRVVVNETVDTDLKSVIACAWESLLSHNFRFNNYKHTWYTGEKYCQYGDGELEPWVMFDRLGITRNVCTEDLAGTGEYLWYEYLPEAVKNAKSASVPLVVLLHGNNNDPRTQAETSGFLPLASRDGFMVAELEWQGNGWAAMGHDGIETVIYHLFEKYPQIDRSRVYCEGLSAGAFNATALGIKKSHVFAAVGAQSGGIMPRLRFGSSKETLFDEARLKSKGVDMPYFSICGSDDEAVLFPKPGQEEPNTIHLAWQAYQMMNNLPVAKTLDFSVDKDFGMKLENRRRESTNKGLFYETGDLCKDGIPLIRAIVVDGYGHWNFQPGAELMWDYFKMFSRDPETKELIYHE